MDKNEIEEKMKEASEYIRSLIGKLEDETINDTELVILEEYLNFIRELQGKNQ